MGKATQVLGIILLGAMTIFTAVGAFKTQKSENATTYGYKEFCRYHDLSRSCSSNFSMYTEMNKFIDNNKVEDINQLLIEHSSYDHIHYMVKYIK